MTSTSRYIILLGLSVGCISMLYWLGLLVFLPFWIICLLIICAIFFLFQWWSKNSTIDPPVTYTAWAWVILFIGIISMMQKTNVLAGKYGGWDAWAIWNLHAKYLADPANWQNMFRNVSSAHADYPICLPATLGFFSRLFNGHFSLTIPFAFSFFIMLCIPVMIYAETVKKNIVVAAFILYLFSQDLFYIAKGTSQYADTLLAFFFLTALMCINHADENKKMIPVTTFLLGCCAWTKNEGMILAVIFTFFYARFFLKRENISYAFAGIILPSIAWFIFKIDNPVSNDLVEKQEGTFKQFLTTKARYKTIYDSFKLNLNEKFRYMKVGIFIYATLCIIEKRLPGKQLCLIATCMFAYMMIYVVTPQDLQWHLGTSQDRLMHQLMPATMYVLANKFSEIRFSLPKKEKAVQ